MQEHQFQSGAVIDIRSAQEKVRDYKFKELVSAIDPVNWQEKSQEQWRKFPIFNQNGSGSCVAQTEAKELGIMRYLKDGNYVHFSATDIYQRRANKPAAGMAAVDVRKIAQQGVTLEALAPSQNLNDAQMDGQAIEPYKREVGSIFAVPNYVELPSADIETIASVIQRTQKGVMVWFYFIISEWTNRPAVIQQGLDLQAQTTARHSVTAVDYTLVGGKKALIIEDSWGSSFGIAGQRVIDEDFFMARNWYAGNLVNFKFDDQTQPQPTPTPKPIHVFNVDLEFGQTNNDIKALQDILRYEGMFPANVQSTGYFGAVTLKGVQSFQVKYGVIVPGESGYGRVGPKTRKTLNDNYGYG